MKNRIGKTIITLLSVIALLIGIMPFASRKAEAATNQIVWDASVISSISLDGKDSRSFSSGGITVNAYAVPELVEGQDYSLCDFKNSTIRIGTGDISFSPSVGSITKIEIECDTVENFFKTELNIDWKLTGPNGYITLTCEKVPMIAHRLYDASHDAPLAVNHIKKITFTVTVVDYNIEVSADPTEGGSVSGGNTYEKDSEATVTATPYKGYAFVNWTENGNEVSTDSTYTFKVTGNRKLVANFVEQYPLWVGSRQVTSAYLSNEEEGWSYDPETNVLTLNNANITDTNTVYSVTPSCISTNEDLTISLSGNNTVGSIDSSSLAIDSYDGVLTITGSGSMTVNSKKLSIFAAGKLIIDNTSVTVNGYITVGSLFDILNGSEVKVASNSGSISVLGTLTVKDSRLEATGDELVVSAEDISISGNSEVKAVATKQTQRVITAIFATDSFEINGLEIVTPEDGKIIKSDADAGIGQEVFTVCDKDGNVAKEVLIKSVTPEYTVTSGAGGTYTIDSGKDYTLTVKRNVNDGSCFDRFAGEKLDGKELTKDTDYTAAKGSTIITLKASTLSRLSEGDHTITVSFIDGKAETSLTVKKASAPTPEPTPATPYQIPKTGIE